MAKYDLQTINNLVSENKIAVLKAKTDTKPKKNYSTTCQKDLPISEPRFTLR